MRGHESKRLRNTGIEQTMSVCVCTHCMCYSHLYISAKHDSLWKSWGNTCFSPCWLRLYKKKTQRWCKMDINNHFEMCDCGSTQATRPVGSQGVVWTDRPLCTSSSPPPARFLIPPSASFWSDRTVVKPLSQHTNAHTPSAPSSPFPHPLPASLACSRLVGIPTACCAMIWLMEFDFQRGSLKRVWFFGTERAGGEGGGVLWG